MKLFYLTLLTIFLPFLPSCSPRLLNIKLDPATITDKSTDKSTDNNISKKALEKIAYIKVKDIECEFCADTVISQLSKISSVTEAKFKHDNYNNKIILAYNNAINKQEISEALSQDGFELDYLKI